MGVYSPEIRFRGTWRPYQKRVLDDLSSMLEGNAVHIVAAPGSGKTVLGLEIMLQLGKPALILAPTITIRDQWAQRFTDLFIPAGSQYGECISRDIRNPNLITVSTYQALYCAVSGSFPSDDEQEDEQTCEDGDCNADEKCDVADGIREELANRLRLAGIGTLIVDEAHHLRNSWWKSLEMVRKDIGDPTVVALTGTPPYDVSELEWKRYTELCGPVDAEISAPELVMERNLCPHQDYIYLTLPTPEEQTAIRYFRKEIDKLICDICNNSFYTDLLDSHPFLANLDSHIEEILNNAEFFSALAIYINRIKDDVPRELMEVLGVSGKKLPDLDICWLEILLNGWLSGIGGIRIEDNPGLREIKKELSRIGAIERGRVYLSSTPKLDRMLISSMSKLEGIVKIASEEYQALGQNLRMVVLTDFVRKNELPSSGDDLKPLIRIGAVPVFEMLRRSMGSEAGIGVLTGSLSIIPSGAESRFRELCDQKGIEESEIGCVPLAADSGYLRVSVSGKLQSRLVQVITDLFTEGIIKMLVGTKSLLGEGWDAPVINSLIIASFVGSYMLSNQMRGRAIRMEAGNPLKTANIWHLVCIDPDNRRGGYDISLLKRRFKAFVGVALNQPVIESGIDRMEIVKPPFLQDDVVKNNIQMLDAAHNRDGLRDKWENSLFKNARYKRMADSVRISKTFSPRNYVFTNSVIHLFWQSINWTGFILTHSQHTIPDIFNFGSAGDLSIMALGFLLAGVITIPACVKSVYLTYKHGPLDWSLRQIGIALLRALCECKIIQTPYNELTVSCVKESRGRAACALVGGTPRESAIFADAFGELLDPVQDPRYIIERRIVIGQFSTHDYHAVPQVLSRKKVCAEIFGKYWGRHVGPFALHYTRDLAGRRILLKARESSLSAGFADSSERVSCWR